MQEGKYTFPFKTGQNFKGFDSDITKVNVSLYKVSPEKPSRSTGLSLT